MEGAYPVLMYNQMALKSNIIQNNTGVYRSVVQTSAGIAAADIRVNVEGEYHVTCHTIFGTLEYL